MVTKQKSFIRVICHNCHTTILPNENIYVEQGYSYCEACGDGKPRQIKEGKDANIYTQNYQ
jgi:RNase P subunit RPR2